MEPEPLDPLDSDKKDIIIHYGDSQFVHELPFDTTTWDNHTFYNLIDVIKERCNLQESVSIYEKIFNEQEIIDDINDLSAMFDDVDSDDDENTPHIYVKVSYAHSRTLESVSLFRIMIRWSVRGGV